MRRREILFPELSYANADHTRLKRWFIRSACGRKVIVRPELEPLRDRKALIAHLYRAVFSLAPERPDRHRAMRPRPRRDGADLAY